MSGRTMRAVVIEEHGDADSMKVKSDVPVPEVGKGQVLIRLKAAGINELEFRIRSVGWRSFKPPFILGLDGAGIIDSVGDDVTKFKPGDRVYVLQPITGTYAEYCLASVDRVYKLHDNLSFEGGAVLAIPYFTALRAIITKASYKKGDSCLVHGASGAVGLAGIQVARGLGASRVIGTAGTDRGRDLVKETGADVVFDYKAENFKEQLKNEVGPKGVDIIFDTNADINLELDFDVAAKNGRIVVVGKKGQTTCTPLKLLTKELTLRGSALFFCDTESRDAMDEVIYRGAEDGWLKPYIGGKFKLDDVSASHLDIENRRGATGKTILIID